MPDNDELFEQIKEHFGLLTVAEAKVAWAYAGGDESKLDAAVRAVVAERVAPYNTDEYKALLAGRTGEGAAPSIGEAESIGEGHSIPGLDPDFEGKPLVTDLAALGDAKGGADDGNAATPPEVPVEQIPEPSDLGGEYDGEKPVVPTTTELQEALTPTPEAVKPPAGQEPEPGTEPTPAPEPTPEPKKGGRR